MISNVHLVVAFRKTSTVMPKMTVAITLMKLDVLMSLVQCLSSSVKMDDAFQLLGSVIQKMIAGMVVMKGISVQRRHVLTSRYEFTLI